MRTELLDYELPTELIAERPPPRRDDGRLLVLAAGGCEHKRVRDLVELVPEGALLVLNDTRVLPARLLGARSSGGKAEFLLLRRQQDGEHDQIWTALGRPAKKLGPGARVTVGELHATVLARGDGGEVSVRLESPLGVSEALGRVGRVPLPPYIARQDDADDRERYQTIYARSEGSAAAPTAGLHLSEELLAAFASRGVERAQVTLHVGLGTFRPVTSGDLDDHEMHSEWFQLDDSVAHAIERARARGRPVVAVGTTVVRALESARDSARPGHVRPCAGETRLLIQPGFSFSVTDSLLTNFHQPRSTLLALVSAFAGLERVRDAYRAALAERYRFLSYGDAMWIPRRAS